MQYLVNKKQSGLKLVHFLAQNLGSEYSVRDLKKALESKLCLVNGKVERFASYKVSLGQVITFHGAGKKEIENGEFDKKRVLFEDDFLLFYNKPAKITSEKMEFNDLYLVNRLDRETSGVIIFAKSEIMKKKMVSLYKKEVVKKEYVALVDGIMKKNSGKIKKLIGKMRLKSGKEVHAIKRNGKVAITDWICIKKGKKASMVTLFPVTGRTHQLRLHMNSIGHPILGDFDYCQKFKCKHYTSRILLHSSKVSFPHPDTGEMVTVFAPIPIDFKKAKDKLVRSTTRP